MSNSRLSQLVLFLILSVLFGGMAFAEGASPFVVSCEDVNRVTVDLVDDPGVPGHIVVGCQVELTALAGRRLDAHCVKWFGNMFPIVAGGHFIAMYDSMTRSIPPQFVFTEEIWEDAEAKFMAICPEKSFEIPQRVLDH